MWKITSMLAVTCLLLPGRADAIRGRFGLEVGANYASLDHRSGTGPYSAHWQWHPCGDVAFDIALPRRFRFVPSLRYQEQGEKVGIADTYFTVRQEIRERWIAASLIMKYETPLGLYALLGPDVGYLLSGNLSGTYSSAQYPHIAYETKYADRGRRGDILMSVGIGWEAPLSGHVVGLESRYLEGLIQRDRPIGYLAPNEQPPAWFAQNYPFPMASSRTRRIEAGVRFLW